MSGGLRDFGVVAKHDLLDSYRSRRVIVWIIIYLLGSIASTLLFIKVIREIETEMAKVVHLSATEKPGTMTASVMESDSFKNVIASLVGDKELAARLVQTPPLGLFFGWLSLTFAPILVILLSSESISSEVASRSARFSVFRTSRLSWTLGKAMGQALVLLLALLLSGIGAWIIGLFRMSQFDALKTLLCVLEFIGKTWVYSLAYLGLAFAVSQWTRSVQLSRSLGILLYFLMAILSALANHYSGEGWKRLWELAIILTPQGHHLDFWRPEAMHQLNAFLFSIGLSALYFFSGYAVFSRRDL
jgi:ABC-type transport system involved in multi-copper enzyme maturation permease subunit